MRGFHVITAGSSFEHSHASSLQLLRVRTFGFYMPQAVCFKFTFKQTKSFIKSNVVIYYYSNFLSTKPFCKYFSLPCSGNYLIHY